MFFRTNKDNFCGIGYSYNNSKAVELVKKLLKLAWNYDNNSGFASI